MKKYLAILSSLLILTGCSLMPVQSNSNLTSSSSSYESIGLPNDEELINFDDYYDLNAYNNKTRMPGNGETPDPYVYRFNGMYYLYITTGGKGIKAYKSNNLVDWDYVENGEFSRGYCYEYDSDSNAPESSTPYAPEVTYYNGKFYMACSPSGNGHYILESDSPEGPFKTITGNVGRSIDGHFFVDKDENIYFYGASGGGIVVYGLENDFTTFNELTSSLSDCRVGNWTEGPYMLNRNGDYYLTYCGTHYLSRSYRIDYTYSKNGADLFETSEYDRKDTILLSTTDDFNGLGHSSTVLGPDMDSYYIVYHNLEGNLRYFNLSRLSFNGSTMVANDVRPGEIVSIASPDFSSEYLDEYVEEGDFYLSGFSTEEAFTCEFNTIGEGEMIFSFVDEDNYSYIEYYNNEINICTVTNGISEIVKSVDLKYDYNIDVLHSFRLQYKDGLMNFYFDNIEKLALEEVSFNPGKIGFFANNEFDDIGYSAFSNVALGSSDKKAYSGDVSLANAYVDQLSILNNGSGLEYCESTVKYTNNESYNMVLANDGDRATYKMQVSEDNYYNINLRFPASALGATVGLKIDNNETIEIALPSDSPATKNGDILYTLDVPYLTAGPHHISICNVGDEISFSEIRYQKSAEGLENDYIFNTSFDTSYFDIRNNLNLDNNGINTDNQSSVALISNDYYTNATVEVNLKVKEEMPSNGYASVLMNVTDFSTNHSADGDGQDNNNIFRGYRFELKKSRLEVYYVDFNFTNDIAIVRSDKISYPLNTELTLLIAQDGNNYTCYLNDEELVSFNGNLGNIQGSVGLLASSVNVSYSSMSVYF